MGEFGEVLGKELILPLRAFLAAWIRQNPQISEHFLQLACVVIGFGFVVALVRTIGESRAKKINNPGADSQIETPLKIDFQIFKQINFKTALLTLYLLGCGGLLIWVPETNRFLNSYFHGRINTQNYTAIWNADFQSIEYEQIFFCLLIWTWVVGTTFYAIRFLSGFRKQIN